MDWLYDLILLVVFSLIWAKIKLRRNRKSPLFADTIPNTCHNQPQGFCESESGHEAAGGNNTDRDLPTTYPLPLTGTRQDGNVPCPRKTGPGYPNQDGGYVANE